MLPAPKITYRKGQREDIQQVEFGKWRIRNWFYGAAIIDSWGLIYFGDPPDRQIDRDLDDFQNQLPEVNFHV